VGNESSLSTYESRGRPDGRRQSRARSDAKKKKDHQNPSRTSLHQSGLDENPEQRTESDARAGHGQTDSTCSFNAGRPTCWSTFGIGGAASPGKRFVGFVSDDADVIDLLIRTLLPIGAPPPPAEQGPPSASALELVKASDVLLDEPASDAGAGAVVVAVGRGADRLAFITALALARREGRALVIVDRSAEGFGSPYHDMRGDDAYRPSPDRLFDITVARREGRGALITYLEAATAAGVVAGGWFPTVSGAEGLAQAGRRFGGAIVVLPSDVIRPSLAERLRGMAADRLGPVIGLPMVVAGEA